MSKKTRYILIFFLCLLFIAVYIFWIRKNMSDFNVCYQGGKRILEGETLYRASDGHLQYKYTPTSAVFFSLFALFSLEAAKFIWYVLELFLFYLILVSAYDVLPVKLKKKGAVLILSFLVLMKFTAREMELGQVNILILFLLLMILLALLKRKDVGAGLLWGASLLFKPYALVFLPYFLLKKRIKLILTGLGVVLIGFVMPSIFYGLKENIIVFKEWQQSLSLSTTPLLDAYDNASLHAFFLKIIPSERSELAWIFILAASALIGAALVWMIWKGKIEGLEKAEVLEFSYLCCLIPLLSPLGWNYNYLYSLLAVVFLLNNSGTFPSWLNYILIANFVVIAASLMEILGEKAFRFYTGYSLIVINYLIVLSFLFYARLTEHRLGNKWGQTLKT